MTLFRYTPYDGSTHPFTMGLQLCDPENWIEIDETFTEQLTQKNDLLDQQPEAVYQRTSGSLKAEGEVLDMLLDYLPKRFPEIYAYKDGIISVKPQTKSFRVCDFSETPLKLAGQLVQEDFCIIQPTDRSHKLTAACLCFPSSWKLADKIGKTLEKVHEPVPGYQQVMANKVNLIFDRLLPDKILWRLNWSLDEGSQLYRPEPHSHDEWLEIGESPFDHIFIRVERQTIRRLPASSSSLFTIRIYTDSLAKLRTHPQAVQLATGLSAQLEAMTSDELAYKGLTKAIGPILKALSDIVSGG